MKSVGEMGWEIQVAARLLGARGVSVGTAPTSLYGRVAIHFPAGMSHTERHEQARTLPCFELHTTERNTDGGCTVRGMVSALRDPRRAS